MAYASHVSQIERRIINRVLRKALKTGYLVSVFDGEEWSLGRSNDMEKITAEIAATDMTTLRFRTHENAILGSVVLVHGNDEDVISDMTDNKAMAWLTDQPHVGL